MSSTKQKADRKSNPKIGEKGTPDGVTNTTKALSAAGVIGAIVLTLLVNILSARHYDRWDFTTAKLYTLSPATLTTLHGLEQNVEVEVLLSSSDPLQRSVKNLLDAYGSETTRLDVRFVDPDRHPAEFVAVQQKYGIVAGRTEDGRVVTDAAIVMASRGRHWFITADDMVDFSEVDEGRTKSKLEQSMTEGIRSVLGGTRRKICFTYGHGEFSLDDNSEQGLGELRDRLLKNNYEPVTVNSTSGDPKEAYEGCDAVVVTGPGLPFTKPEADVIAERMRAGMSGLFMLNPMLDADRKAQLDTGLESVAKMFGIGIVNDYVFELDNDARVPRGTGEVFFPTLEPHATTDGLVGPSLAIAGLRIVAVRARSFDAVPAEVQPTTIMKTSDQAFGMKDFYRWVETGGEPTKGRDDRSGPLAIGMAAELPKAEGAEQHGARLVVLGTANPALGQNWRDMALRGNAVLTGNILSWIASKPPIVDIPAKVTPAATLRITEGSLNEIVRYVLVFMPAAALLLGVAVYLRRRSRDDRPKGGKPNEDDGPKGKQPVVRPSPGGKDKQPVVRPSPGGKDKQPVVRPSPGGKDKQPVVRPSPGGKDKAEHEHEDEDRDRS
jgi:gliding motility-associatede transport system auxiliary component